MKRRLLIITIIIIGCLVALFFYPLRSYIVMSAATIMENRDSVMTQNDMDINMPGGLSTLKKDWYPFVITHNNYGLDNWVGGDVDISIMYNFGAFDRARSTIYDQKSDYYSAFYGAYVLKSDDFGHDGDDINLDDITKVVEYDYTELVIEDIGCDDHFFDIQDMTISNDIEYIDIAGWTRIDAVIATNGISHGYEENKLGYLQYGKPNDDVTVDFPETKLYGRIYAKYFKEQDVTIGLYIIAPNMETIRSCDDNFLSKTNID